MAKLSHANATKLLCATDRNFAKLVKAAGPPRFRKPFETHFEALVRSIVFQQLAGAAASTIHSRLLDLVGSNPTPKAIMAEKTAKLRSVGLSANKSASIQDLSTKVLNGEVILDPVAIRRLSDEDIASHLVSVRGIGQWTADMFLMFQLRRLDVWPTGDLGVRKGFGLAWNIEMPTPKQLEALGESFRPYRSVVAWYCWRAVDLYGGRKS